MKMLHRWELEWTTVITSDTAEVVVPMGNYQRTSPGATSARGWLEMRAEEGSIQVACSVTLANDVTAAGTATKVNSLVSTEGVSDPSTAVTVTSAFQGNKYVRPSFNIKSGDGNMAAARVRGWIEVWQ